MRRAAALAPVLLWAGCTFRPDLAYVAETAGDVGEPEAWLTLMPVEDRRPPGDVVIRYGDHRYLLMEETATRWVAEALRDELARRGLRAVPGNEAGEGWALQARLAGLRYLPAPFHIRGAVFLELELRRDGRPVFWKAYAREGEPSWSIQGPEGTCAETLNEALRAVLIHAVPEIVQAIRDGS